MAEAGIRSSGDTLLLTGVLNRGSSKTDHFQIVSEGELLSSLSFILSDTNEFRRHDHGNSDNMLDPNGTKDETRLRSGGGGGD